MLTNWFREIEKFGGNIKAVIYHGTNRDQELLLEKDTNIILTTYATAVNDLELLQKQKYSIVVFDEVQTIKNSESKTYHALSDIESRVRIGLTGTPMENNLSELWSIMNILNPNCFGSRQTFCNKYTNSDFTGLREYLKVFLLRRTKSLVLSDLPAKTEEIIYSDMTSEQSSLYKATLAAIKKEIDRHPSRFEIKSNSYIFQALLYLREICDHPKLLPLSLNVNRAESSGKFEILKIKLTEIYQSKQKVLVFSQFTSMLKIIEEWIIEQNFQYYYLDGQSNDRQKIVDDFQDSDYAIFLISLKAGGTGLNLTSAQYVIIYDPWWNPAAEQQASDRIYRIGQQNSVTIYKMITTNSIEEKVHDLQIQKTDLFNDVIENLDDVRSLSIDQLKKLLM